MAAVVKKASKRLMADLEEINSCSNPHVSAVPLEENIFEWHCNIRNKNIIYHVILFFPQNYPYQSPSAEFVPPGFFFDGVASANGSKGTKICLNIFSDFNDYHTEWATEKNSGWSPGYTVQAILMNLVSFLSEQSNRVVKNSSSLCRDFACRDCGHTSRHPFPVLGVASDLDSPVSGILGSTLKAVTSFVYNTFSEAPSAEQNEHTQHEESEECKTVEEEKELPIAESNKNLVIDYISKQEFVDSDSIIYVFGFGIIVSGPKFKPKLTSPCEFITDSSFFGMRDSIGYAQSIMKEKLSFFLPLYITENHGKNIASVFETILKELRSINQDKTSNGLILNLIPNLMCSSVVEYFQGKQYTSESNLNGYFLMHRLFLWAVRAYPSLQSNIETSIRNFVENGAMRKKENCPDLGKWLMLLSVSNEYTWKDVADVYLKECRRRNVMWYTKEDPNLKLFNMNMIERLNKTFFQTKVSRGLLAFQVAFLDVAKPKEMSQLEIERRYDENSGFPTAEMIGQMKQTCDTIKNDITDYESWYKALKLEYPSDRVVFEDLKSALSFAFNTKGYFFSLENQNNSRHRGRYRNN